MLQDRDSTRSWKAPPGLAPLEVGSFAVPPRSGAAAHGTNIRLSQYQHFDIHLSLMPSQRGSVNEAHLVKMFSIPDKTR